MELLQFSELNRSMSARKILDEKKTKDLIRSTKYIFCANLACNNISAKQEFEADEAEVEVCAAAH